MFIQFISYIYFPNLKLSTSYVNFIEILKSQETCLVEPLNFLFFMQVFFMVLCTDINININNYYYGVPILKFSLLQMIAHISGAHLNPAVTIATVIFGHLKPLMGLVYIIAQFAGATLGFGLLKVSWFIIKFLIFYIQWNSPNSYQLNL